MNRNDDIERVLELWFTEGPRHMPDRLFDATFERIERLPKRRLADLQSRLPAMNLNLRLAAAAALVVALVGAGFIAMNGIPSVGNQPSPSPTTEPTVTGAALQSWWSAVGDRDSPADWGPTDNTFQIDATGLAIEQTHGNVLSSWSLIDGGSRLVLRWEREVLGSVPSNQRWGCYVGDEGVYSVRFAEGGARMTLGLVSDPCAPRAAFVAGEWIRCGTSCGDEVTANAEATPSSTAIPAPTAVPTLGDDSFPTASDLRGHWTAAEPRPIDNGTGTATWEMVFDPLSFEAGGTGHTVTGPWFINEPGTLSIALWSQPTNWGCAAGDQGLYDIRINGDHLTVSVRTDVCSVRPAMLVGNWTRTPPGQLASARRTLTTFRPFGAGTTGRMSTTIPAQLLSGEGEAGVALSNPFAWSGIAQGIVIDSRVTLVAQPSGCANDLAGVGRDPAAVVDWLATNASLLMTDPIPVTVGEVSGLMVDASRNPNTKAGCDATDPPLDIWIYKVMPDVKSRWIFLDRGDGQSIFIRLDTPSTTLAAEDGPMAIVNDFEFIR